jgi:DNA-binding XRE family transcriptional regulator
MSKTDVHLLVLGRRALSLPSQGAMGRALGASRRTGQRWERGQAHPSPSQWIALARLVYARDAALAQEVAAKAGTTVEALGLVPPPAPVPTRPVDPTTLPSVVQVHSVVLAVADVMDASPRQVRPWIYAAFARARQLGLSVETVEETLRPAEGPKGGKGGKT